MPPVFLITYTTTRTDAITYETEWVTPGNYDRDRACETFRQQFPSAAVVRCEETE